MNSSDFVKLAKKQKKIPKHIRLYIISKNHYFINGGIFKNGFDSKLAIENNRESVLSAFSKMAFIFDELIRLRIVGYTNNQNSVELMYLLHLIPTNRKIRTFLDWKLFSPEFAKDMSRLFLVRNSTTHCISLDEVVYKPDKKLFLSQTNGFNLFKRDLTIAWKSLLGIYILEQEKISWEILLREIKL